MDKKHAHNFFLVGIPNLQSRGEIVQEFFFCQYGITTNRNFGAHFQTITKRENNQQLLQHQFEMEENCGRNVQK